MPTDALTALLKRHYGTGCYGNAHLRMRREDFDAYPKEPRREDFSFRSPLASLLAIPVVVDDGLGPGVWQLVDNSTKEILFIGSSAATTAEGGGEADLSNAPETLLGSTERDEPTGADVDESTLPMGIGAPIRGETPTGGSTP